jgi:hypothetical protein
MGGRGPGHLNDALVKKPRLGILGATLLWCNHHISGMPLIGVFGYIVEWFLELSHVSPAVHHLRLFAGKNSARLGLLAVTMVLVGHYTEHLHQETENHEQEQRSEQVCLCTQPLCYRRPQHVSL